MSEVMIVRGLPELKDTYKTLPDKLKRGVLRRGVSSMARVVANEVKRTAPVKSGRMKRSVIVKRARELQTTTQVGMLVTILRGKKYQSVGKRKVNKDAYYWPWVEMGHRIVPRRKNKWESLRAHRREVERGRFGRVKRVPPVAFIQEALESSASRAVGAMYDRLKTELSFPKVRS